MNLQLLLTGDELMTGDIIDSNSAMVADKLKPIGLRLQRKVVVGDQLSTLVREIKDMSVQADVLIINGGLGPTVDDLTAQALAEVIQQPLREHPQALAELTAWCERRGYPLNTPNRKQAVLPNSVDVISNRIGSAPGFQVVHNNCLIMCTPGVPSELSDMLDVSIIPTLKIQYPSEHASIIKYQVFGVGESSLQKMIGEAFSQWPAEIELGFRAVFPVLEVKLSVNTSTGLTLLPQWQQNIEQLLGMHIIAQGDVSLAEEVVGLLADRKQSIALAESCTGGLIASNITKVAGASQVFEAGIVCYSNTIKHKILGVSNQVLSEYGAVSEPVVNEMAAGALALANADYAVAVSGVAGPGGGSEEKPVGTVWIAWGKTNGLRSRQFYFPYGREYFQIYVAAVALDLIRRDLLGSTETPNYFLPKQ